MLLAKTLWQKKITELIVEEIEIVGLMAKARIFTETFFTVLKHGAKIKL